MSPKNKLKNKILIVEGNDDLHVIWALLEHHKVPETFSVKVGGEKDGGINEVLEELEARLLAASNLECVGIVVDADVDIEKRWREITNILNKAKYTNIPSNPNPNGTILSEKNKITFGAWLMPDNVLHGMLEDFLSYLVPENDALWTHAVSIVDDIPEKRFIEQHTTKAQMHTYLAWQDVPGRPMGLSITMRYLRAENPQAETFITWLKNLFS